MPNWKKVLTSGSAGELSSLFAPSITGSLLGTASYAVTASLPLEGIVTASSDMNHITFTKGNGSTFNILLSTGSVASASYSATASYVLPLVQNVTITGSLLLTGSHISEVDYIDFRNIGTSLPADQQGRIYWDDDNGTLSLGMHGGQVVQQIGLEEYYYIKNQTGTTLQNGSVIRAAGTLGASGRILGDLMIADGTIPYFFTLGIATEAIVDGDDGYVTQFGLVRGINTTGSNGETWVDGDILYVSPTVAGTLTKFEPEAPNLRIQMAIVVDAATNGSIFVRPDLGSNVGSLHDVIDTTTTSSYGELFVKSGSVWTSTKQLTGSYALTGSLVITGSTSGDLLRITQTGTGNAFVVEDSTNPDVTPFVVTATGNVGIGASAPVVKLDVSGSVNLNNSYLFWAYDGASNNDYIVHNDSTHLSSNNTSGFYVFKTDRTITSASGSGNSTLDAGSIWMNSTTETNYIAGNIGIGITTPSAKLHINNTTPSSSFLVEDSTNPDVTPFVIDASGNVGIGKSTPTAKLDVEGNVLVTGSLSITGSTNLNGSLTTKTTRITASSYTASINDYRIAIRYTDTGSVSVQLPLISQVGQIEYRFKDEEGNATVNPITLVVSGSNLIDGSSTALLKRNYIAVSIYNDGVSNWYIE